MNHLIYLSYGDGPHVDELRFSVQSALSYHGESDFKITILTDDPSRFEDLPVEKQRISTEQLDEWQGDHGYHYRRKIAAARHALMTLGGKIALVDTDTYFLKHPRNLFNRIGPGASLLHRQEVHLDRCGASHLADHLTGVRLSKIDGSFWDIDANTPMWNSGVIGLEGSSLPWLDEALHLTDLLCQAVSLRTIEQFALGAVLSRKTKLRECDEIVFHYYEGAQRFPFQERATTVSEASPQPTAEEFYKQLYPHRPRRTFPGDLRARLGRFLRRAGYTRDKQRKIT
ncbi:MAG: hypothetical protein EOP84_07510 [Verrucomicrobiaceae bacterium]|nr:MAG: hypothetical protein EOP84_07510 [Verrucomicrobiaceae bacterium]